MPVPRIAVRMPYLSSYCRQVLRGIADFAHSISPWRFVGNPVYSHYLAPRAVGDGCDGMIVHAVDPAELERLSLQGVPAVNVSGLAPPSDLPRVCVNNRAIGAQAAEHLLDLGLRHLAYVDAAFPHRFEQRRDAFVERARAEGVGIHCLEVAGRWMDGCWVDEDSEGRLAQFLRDLPRPAGILTPYDQLSIHTVECCARLGLNVPDEMAVMGVGNDELLCDFSNPGLTSLDVNARQVGYEAARTLHEMLEGSPAPTEVHYVDPLGVVPRESTDVLALADPVVAQAVRFIRSHACRGISVTDVVEEVPLARRALERRFRDQMHRTILEEIRRIQIQSARFHLEMGSRPVQWIARRCGFRDAKYFCKAFRAEVGTTPSAYRKNHAAQ